MIDGGGAGVGVVVERQIAPRVDDHAGGGQCRCRPATGHGPRVDDSVAGVCSPLARHTPGPTLTRSVLPLMIPLTVSCSGGPDADRVAGLSVMFPAQVAAATAGFATHRHIRGPAKPVPVSWRPRNTVRAVVLICSVAPPLTMIGAVSTPKLVELLNLTMPVIDVDLARKRVGGIQRQGKIAVHFGQVALADLIGSVRMASEPASTPMVVTALRVTPPDHVLVPNTLSSALFPVGPVP